MERLETLQSVIPAGVSLQHSFQKPVPRFGCPDTVQQKLVVSSKYLVNSNLSAPGFAREMALETGGVVVYVVKIKQMIFVPHKTHVDVEQLVLVNKNLPLLMVFIARLIVIITFLAEIKLLHQCLISLGSSELLNWKLRFKELKKEGQFSHYMDVSHVFNK